MLWFAPSEVILKQGVLFEFHLSTTGTHQMFYKIYRRSCQINSLEMPFLNSKGPVI